MYASRLCFLVAFVLNPLINRTYATAGPDFAQTPQLALEKVT